MASQIITCPTITVTSGTALTAPSAWDISDASGFAVVSGGSTTVTVQVAFMGSSDATFSDLLSPIRSYSTGNHTATVVTTSGAFMFADVGAKQVRFLSTGTIAAGFSITGAKFVDI